MPLTSTTRLTQWSSQEPTPLDPFPMLSEHTIHATSEPTLRKSKRCVQIQAMPSFLPGKGDPDLPSDFVSKDESSCQGNPDPSAASESTPQRAPIISQASSRPTSAGDPSQATAAGATPDSLRDAELRKLFTELFDELHVQARRTMARQSKEHTLQPTALIGEVYLRFQRSGRGDWENRDHFLMSASRVMRSVLVDHYRAKHTLKRGKEREVIELDHIADAFQETGIDLEALDIALHKLEEEQPEMARAVQLRFFGGVEMKEIARILDMSPRTLERRWYTVRGWLRSQLS